MERKRAQSGQARLAEVAAMAGVSLITASRYFRDATKVSLAKRERIASAASELGYVPNLAARALASQRADIVGVIIPSLTNNVFSEVLRGIYDASEDSRYSIQLGNTRYSIFQEERLLKVFLGQRPAGMIVTGINQTDTAFDVLKAMDCPIVQIMEIGPKPVDMMIGFSHFDAGFAAASHLLSQGFRHIGFLGARMDPRVQRRYEGYCSAMKQASLFDAALAVTTTVPSSVTIGSTLLGDVLNKAPHVDAVFCANDDVALGALFECQRRHIAVPDRMAIMGFNDLEYMASAAPSLSSVRSNRYEMGQRAITMLLDAIAGRRSAQTIIDLGFEVVPRQSSLRPARALTGAKLAG